MKVYEIEVGSTIPTIFFSECFTLLADDLVEATVRATEVAQAIKDGLIKLETLYGRSNGRYRRALEKIELIRVAQCPVLINPDGRISEEYVRGMMEQLKVELEDE